MSVGGDVFSGNGFKWWNINANKSILPLHVLNKTRLEYIALKIGGVDKLKNLSVLDYGCGGGLLCEPLARLGCKITGYDKEQACIKTASEHALEQTLNIKYTDSINPSDKYDIICCFEMLEHATNYSDEITQISKLLKPNGIAFFSTINRNLKSLVLAKVIGEYILNLVPRGIHDFKMFIKPSELEAVCNKNNLKLVDLSGMLYNPLTKISKITKNTDVNYICCFVKNNE